MNKQECKGVREILIQRRSALLRWVNKLCRKCFDSIESSHNYSLRHLPPSSTNIEDPLALKEHMKMCESVELGDKIAQEGHADCDCARNEKRVDITYKNLLKSRTYTEWKIIREQLKEQIEV